MTVRVAGHAMTMMPLTYPRLLQSQAKTPSNAPSCFQPLDPAIVSAAIPTFFVGRNRDGFWLARDAKGELGGIFLLRSSALAFARRASRSHGCATIFLSERFELDVENQGNPLIAWLKPIVRFATAAWKRAARIGGT
jgi:hypothetical protein